MVGMISMSILILGTGNVGEAIAFDLSKDYEVVLGDADPERLKEMDEKYGTLNLDATSEADVKNEVREHDLIICALPGKFGYDAVKWVIETGKDIVDVSFMPEDPFELDDIAKENNVSAIVDAGFGPGMSNLFMGYIKDHFDKIKETMIKIGGLPTDPVPPLFYKVTWSPDDLIEEYTREARMKRDGNIVNLEPLEDITEVRIKDFEFEEFYSDGLRTLLKTIPTDDLEETTLRWPGHLEKMNVLKELGFFEENDRKNTLNVIALQMDFESDDFCIMTVECKGVKDCEDCTVEFYFYDVADEKFSSMSRSTGFATASFARLLMNNELDAGIIPPEYLGINDNYFDYIIERMKDYGIEISRTLK
ncbi:MAG: saccharopine dehydrogenase family protein [Thermoplasmatota archaeon]